MMRKSRGIKGLLIVVVVITAFFLIKHYSTTEINPYTLKRQAISITPQEEVQIGLAGIDYMISKYGGLHSNQVYQTLVDSVGYKLVNNSIAKKAPYQFEFHLLADDKTINAFSLPGGQICITYALFVQLKNEDQLASILGHEIGHVLGRHATERIANNEQYRDLIAANNVDEDLGAFVSQISNGILLKNERNDELESDNLGVKFMIKANYNPEDMVGVMQILKAAAQPNRVQEFQRSHPDPENRIEHIRASIEKYRQN